MSLYTYAPCEFLDTGETLPGKIPVDRFMKKWAKKVAAKFQRRKYCYQTIHISVYDEPMESSHAAFSLNAFIRTIPEFGIAVSKVKFIAMEENGVFIIRVCLMNMVLSLFVTRYDGELQLALQRLFQLEHDEAFVTVSTVVLDTLRHSNNTQSLVLQDMAQILAKMDNRKSVEVSARNIPADIILVLYNMISKRETSYISGMHTNKIFDGPFVNFRSQELADYQKFFGFIRRLYLKRNSIKLCYSSQSTAKWHGPLSDDIHNLMASRLLDGLRWLFGVHQAVDTEDTELATKRWDWAYDVTAGKAPQNGGRVLIVVMYLVGLEDAIQARALTRYHEWYKLVYQAFKCEPFFNGVKYVWIPKMGDVPLDIMQHIMRTRYASEVVQARQDCEPSILEAQDLLRNSRHYKRLGFTFSPAVSSLARSIIKGESVCQTLGPLPPSLM